MVLILFKVVYREELEVASPLASFSAALASFLAALDIENPPPLVSRVSSLGSRRYRYLGCRRLVLAAIGI